MYLRPYSAFCYLLTYKLFHVVLFLVILLLSTITTTSPAIRAMIPAIARTPPVTRPAKKFTLSWLFWPTNGRLPNNIPILTRLPPRLVMVRVYFPITSGLIVVTNCFAKSLVEIISPFGFLTVSLRIGFAWPVSWFDSILITRDNGRLRSLTWVSDLSAQKDK